MSEQPAQQQQLETLEPTLQNLLEQQTLKWIFVGGKGGVGKTTSSSCLAIQLAKVRSSVLIISTDPAHNLSDAFDQKFSKAPTLVAGFTNLYAMEIEPKIDMKDMESVMPTGLDRLGLDMSMFQEMASSMPGIDEAMGFAEIMKQVQSMEFSVIVFDTAPTGHTLRFLNFPSLLEKTLGRLFSLRQRFSGILSQMTSMMGLGSGDGEEIFGKLEQTKKIIEEVNQQFKNPDLTTFVCVCIPEFLSLYETERLVQELTKFEIDCHNVIINQVLYPDHLHPCALCVARSKMQSKYIEQIIELYFDFHVVKMPLLPEEVRGKEKLEFFGKYLLTPYRQ